VLHNPKIEEGKNIVSTGLGNKEVTDDLDKSNFHGVMKKKPCRNKR
jgi:hypothetical protein